jgi:hypothetical protein
MEFNRRSVPAVVAGVASFLAVFAMGYHLLVPVFQSFDKAQGGWFPQIGDAIFAAGCSFPIGAFLSGLVTARIADRDKLKHLGLTAAGLAVLPLTVGLVLFGPVELTVAIPALVAYGAFGALGAAAGIALSPREADLATSSAPPPIAKTR